VQHPQFITAAIVMGWRGSTPGNSMGASFVHTAAPPP
jgi:hypothetical protein